MQARCPHCSSVFTTDRTGIQFCPNCGQQLDVPAVAGGPAAAASAGTPFGSGEGPPGGARAPTSWERRGELGFFKGYLETWKGAVLEPSRFFETVEPQGQASDAVLFGWLSQGLPMLLFSPLFALIFVGQMSTAMSQMPSGANNPLSDFHLSFGMAMAMVIGIALFIPVGLVIQAAFVHLGCLMTGSARNGYTATLRALGYAAAPQVFGFIPVVNLLVAFYGIALQIIGIQKVQETTTAKAIISVLWILILCLCCTCLVPLMFAGAFAGRSH